MDKLKPTHVVQADGIRLSLYQTKSSMPIESAAFSLERNRGCGDDTWYPTATIRGDDLHALGRVVHEMLLYLSAPKTNGRPGTPPTPRTMREDNRTAGSAPSANVASVPVASTPSVSPSTSTPTSTSTSTPPAANQKPSPATPPTTPSPRQGSTSSDTVGAGSSRMNPPFSAANASHATTTLATQRVANDNSPMLNGSSHLMDRGKGAAINEQTRANHRAPATPSTKQPAPIAQRLQNNGQTDKSKDREATPKVQKSPVRSGLAKKKIVKSARLARARQRQR